MQQMRRDGALNSELAKEFGVSERTVIRHCRGLLLPPSKLTFEEVQAIRRSSATPAALADRYRVSLSTIKDILQRRTWKCRG